MNPGMRNLLSRHILESNVHFLALTLTVGLVAFALRHPTTIVPFVAALLFVNFSLGTSPRQHLVHQLDLSGLEQLELDVLEQRVGSWHASLGSFRFMFREGKGLYPILALAVLLPLTPAPWNGLVALFGWLLTFDFAVQFLKVFTKDLHGLLRGARKARGFNRAEVLVYLNAKQSKPTGL
jgi:hypothetical protein